MIIWRCMLFLGISMVIFMQALWAEDQKEDPIAPLQQLIYVLPEHQECSSDLNCTLIEVDCNSGCECASVPVNRGYKELYDKQLYQCRKDKLLAWCDLDCLSVRSKCHEGICVRE